MSSHQHFNIINCSKYTNVTPIRKRNLLILPQSGIQLATLRPTVTHKPLIARVTQQLKMKSHFISKEHHNYNIK